MNNQNDRLEQFAKYATGRLAADELRELESQLRLDADYRCEFIEYLNLDSALSDLSALSNAEIEQIELESTSASSKSEARLNPPRLTIAVGIGIAATLLLLASVSIWIASVDSDRAAPGVTVAVLSDQQIEVNGVERQLKQGQQESISHFRVPRGLLRLKLGSGVVLDLFGPMEGEFEGPSRLRIDQGRLNADVGEDGKGFTIVTTSGDIVDLGTRFGVDVRDGEADVAVFSGEVQIHSVVQTAASKGITIGEGEAMQMRSGQKPRRLSSVQLARNEVRFAPTNIESIVTKVTDNAESATFRSFYGVIAGGMNSGTTAYTDRLKVAWQPLEGQLFPSELIGADVVCPFHRDRHAFELTITLHLSTPAIVYVLHDSRKPALGWLKRGFIDTGLKIRSGKWPESPVVREIEADRNGEFFVEYSVWEKRIDVAGNVQLGPPHAAGEGGRKTMYGIAVKAFPEVTVAPAKQ